jgi:septal ring factor EnvC (AmiA/AmiB activator)
MKTLIIIIFLSLTSSGFSQFWKSKPKPTPTPVPVAEVVVKPENTTSIQEARKIIKELNSELTVAKDENTKLKVNLENANKKVEDAEGYTAIVQKNADILKNWGIEQQNQSFKWMEKYTSTIKRYHKLKTIAAIVSALFGAMLGMYCMRLIPPVYAAYAFTLPIAGAILAFGGVWMFF